MTIDKKTLKRENYEYKERLNNVLLLENFDYKIALKKIEEETYEILCYSNKKYIQGRLFNYDYDTDKA